MKIRIIKGGRYRGYLFWQERWFSFCSAHYEYRNNCPMCTAGSWKNVWAYKIERLIDDVKKSKFKQP